MSEEHIPEFEDRLRMLLARTAEAIPDDTDIAPRVRQATGRVRSAGGTAGPRSLLAAVAAVLVVVLLASVLLFVRPLGPLRPAGGVIARPTATATALPTPVGSPPVCNIASLHNYSRPPAAVDHSVAVGRSASVNGITITIDRAYADATQTIISYHMETNINPPSPWNPVLIDAQGQRYALFSGVWSIDSVSYFAFTPLPPAELGTPLTLTFFAPQMQLDLPEPTAKAALVDGPWQITFSLVPQAGTSYTLSNAPVTRSGVTVQPLRIDVAPAGGGLDGVTGGARVIVRVSGLAPDVLLSDLAKFDFRFDLVGGDSCGSGGVLELVLPNGQPITPGSVYAPGLTVPITTTEQKAALTQTVGPSGAVDLAAVFYKPIPSVSSLILYMDQLEVQIAGAAKVEKVSGPWEFQLRPSA